MSGDPRSQEQHGFMQTIEEVLSGGGEMGARMREIDWSKTSLGEVALWPQSLKTAVRILLTSRQPMFVWWGDELINLYNDAYKAIVGGKHPTALGQPASQVWHEIWDQVGPRAASAMLTNEGTYDEALLLIMERYGYPEETYYTFSYSPVPNDQGGTGGIICANTDDTRRIISERQLALLRELAATTADARTFDDACKLSVRGLGTNPRDLPFAMIYLVDSQSQRLCLAGTAGISEEHPAVPGEVVLDNDHDGETPWPFSEVLTTHRAQLVSELGCRFTDLPQGAWDRPPHQAVCVPIAPSGQRGRAGVLVVGLNPLRLFDDNYRGFIDLVAAQIAASIANAQAYEEERKRAEALTELDRAKTAFFSNVSHEFRTPLTLMLGPLAEMLAKPEDELLPEARELLTVAHRNGQRLLKLVNTLLDFSRIEAGRVQAVYEPTDLAAYTAELASVFRSAIEKAGMRLVIDCPPLPEPVFVDRDMWEKIVLNLVSNAFKYTLDGEIEVAVRAAGRAATLTVRDTGSGIAAAELPKVFNRFHRVEGVQGRTHEGTGIGLALVLELVKLHGGKVGIESTVGDGSTFTVTVPLGNAHLPEDRISPSTTATPTHDSATPFLEEALRWLPDESIKESIPVPAYLLAGNAANTAGDAKPKPRILLADDNADMRNYVRRLLLPFYQVTAVADGERAWQEAVAHVPDLVLTDVMMPKLDGFGLLSALRSEPRTATIPVILLSARAGQEARVEGLAAGADDYLIKPFHARELLARVDGTLALSRVRQEANEALRASEERFRLMADHAPVMVWVTEPDGSCSFLSKSWYDFTGQTPETGLGFGWIEAVHPDDRAAARTTFLSANAKKEAFRLDYRLWHVSGEYRWAIDAAAPRFAPGGAFLGYIGSVIDITDRKQAEQALLEADQRKDEFLAILAHELRNPLAPIRTGLELLKVAGSDGQMAERARAMMQRQVAQMVRLIDDLLDVGRISRRNIELRKERIELASVVRSAMESTLSLIEQAGHLLTVHMPGEVLLVDGDAARLTQVFANLLNNAAHYTHRGGRIELRVEQRGSEAVVSVKDTGIGIPKEMLVRVFDMFTQVDRSLERSRGGLGIGLSLAKRFVELHGGTIEAKSDGEGKGSELVVRLPLLVSPGGELEARGQEQSGTSAPARRRILIADDNADAAAMLVTLLELMGNEVRMAHDGVEAVEMAAAFRPDVIILDIGMPTMNGYEACRRIREQAWAADLSIFALTGWGQEADRRRSHEAGFNGHLVKPVDGATLQALLAGEMRKKDR